MSDKHDWAAHVDLLQWAQAGTHREFAVAMDGMNRLDVDRSRSAGEAQIALIGSVYESRTEWRINGRIQAVLPRICQRCLEPMVERADCEFLWLLARDESEYRSLDERYESVLLCDEPQDLITLIEDELILSVALAPVHEKLTDCDPALLTAVHLDGDDDVSIKRPNPFAVLRDLKDD